MACSVIASLPPSEKKQRITEICLNQTLRDLKFNALEKEQDAVAAFSDSLTEKREQILRKVQSSGNDVPTLKKRNTDTDGHKTDERREISVE